MRCQKRELWRDPGKQLFEYSRHETIAQLFTKEIGDAVVPADEAQ